VAIHRGNGAGGFALPTPVSLVASAGPMAAGDLNNDGKMDLAVGVGASGVAILRGTGTGTFSAATYVAVAGSPTGVAVGDWNGDFKLDLAVTVGAANTCFVYLGDGTGGFGAATSFPVGTNPILIATGDFNGDSDPDLAVAVRRLDEHRCRCAGDGRPDDDRFMRGHALQIRRARDGRLARAFARQVRARSAVRDGRDACHRRVADVTGACRCDAARLVGRAAREHQGQHDP